MPVNLVSTIVTGGFIAGVLASRFFFPDVPSRTPSTPPSEVRELIAEASKAQLPAQHVADELEAFIDRAALALQSQTPVGEVLAHRSALGARVYAFYRKSPLGARVHSDEDPAGDGSLRPHPNPNERLTPRELAVWKQIAQKGGGWCAYVTTGPDSMFRPEYVYVKRPRLPAGPDIYISAGFRL